MTVVLSVVVPCYRAEAHLARCLDSVLDHSGDDIELIAVDDGSPDSTGALLDACPDPRLRVIHVEANGGPGPARNTGLAKAGGEYVWFVDADDWLAPGAVAAVLARLAVDRPDVLVVGHAAVFDSGVSAQGSLAQSACTKVIRRGLLDEQDIRFPPGWYEDVYFSLAVMAVAPRIEVLDTVCYCYRQRTSGSITTSCSDRHFDVFDQYGRLLSRASGEGRRALFGAMLDHYLVILGNRYRLPAGSRKAFFRRIVEDYRRWLPDAGYPRPSGTNRLKHWLVRRDAYRSYAALRLAYRILPRRSPSRRGR